MFTRKLKSVELEIDGLKDVEDVEYVEDAADVGHLPLLLRPDQGVLLLVLVQHLVICPTTNI